MKKTVSLLLAFSILSSVLSPVSFALNGDTYSNSFDIANGLNYSYHTEDFIGEKRLQSFALEYTPNSDVFPIVIHGSDVYGKLDINEAISLAKSKGYNIVGGINSDFFSIGTGVPTGILIEDGELITSDGFWNGIAFSSDGTATVGAPQMTMTMTNNFTGVRYPIYALNKDRTGNGIYLFNKNYFSDTKTTLGGTTVVLEKFNNEPLKIGKHETFKVVSVEWKNTSTPLSDTQYVMTYNDKYTGPDDLSTLQIGDVLTLDITASESFSNAVFASGGGDILAIDGVLTDKATTTSTAPRSILGSKPDGSFKVYAIDGRQSVTSKGLNLKECAELLIKEGYSTVINLDGGGSTSMAVQMPGDTTPYVVNSPSEGSLRKCSTFILFANKTQKQSPINAQTYPINPVVLANSKTKVYSLAYDKNFNGSGEVENTFTSDKGVFEEGYFIAPTETGDISINGETSSLTNIPTTFTIIDRPDKIFMLRKGVVQRKDISVAINETIDFNALSFYKSRKVLGVDEDYKWEIEGNCGTVDNMGNFTASSIAGSSGKLTLSAGGNFVSVNIEVGTKPYIINDFESDMIFAPISTPESSANANISKNLEDARFGNGAMVVNFNKTENTLIELPINIRNGTKSLSVWNKFLGKGDVYLDFALNDDTVNSVQIGLTENWAPQIMSIPQNLKSISIRAVNADGKLYIDKMYGFFDEGYIDSSAPIIQLISIENGLYTLSLFDDTAFPTNEISVLIDGEPMDFNFNPQNSTLTFAPPLDETPHRVSVEAIDFFGNKSKTFFDVIPEIYQTGFKDMTESWAKPYVALLENKNVFSEAELFNPTNNATSAMVATLVSRYMNIDTTQYENIELPYKDVENIPNWAISHVKALYSLGIMNGSKTEDGHMFLPDNFMTRAQVMTILGRTIERGFIFNEREIGFDDDGDIPSWAWENISLLKHLSIVSGYGGQNIVKANAPIQRSELAALLYRLY